MTVQILLKLFRCTKCTAVFQCSAGHARCNTAEDPLCGWGTVQSAWRPAFHCRSEVLEYGSPSVSVSDRFSLQGPRQVGSADFFFLRSTRHQSYRLVCLSYSAVFCLSSSHSISPAAWGRRGGPTRPEGNVRFHTEESVRSSVFLECLAATS
ncbi:hypothetical protein CSUI_006362 [Cystoisospora suis]|uniref:Secreted protein n=1 Tax=Cystoisospora suis TaxID=483139 RepID=A0A2C6KQK7_9APIC|nr:hypothetical protein CSUI_006360 [Cystoisospora suis]PHJ19808.1 hypothetical protein CSUI_006361 [Cystoisospora suis]PHJ19809.1 hypothetical protein CSUI_006362 [Cystoisospora suis]